MRKFSLMISMTYLGRLVLTAALAPAVLACGSTAPAKPAAEPSPPAPATPLAQPVAEPAPLRSSTPPLAARAPDSPIPCTLCDEWNRPHEPFKVYGNTYYVGPAGLSSVVIKTSDGLILLDGGLPQSAEGIDGSIRKLGLRTEDIHLIVNSHAHFDHAGGIAALQKLSNARVAASAPGARALEAGEPTEDDPQYTSGHEAKLRYAAVPHVEVVNDGQRLTQGDVTITAHLTPGHTPGSTTWTWKSCDAGRCLNMVYADSLNPAADEGFRFSGDATHPSRVAAFRKSIDIVDHLPCDIIISVHPSFTKVDDKLAARAKGGKSDPFIDRKGCHTYAAEAAAKLDKRVADEQ